MLGEEQKLLKGSVATPSELTEAAAFHATAGDLQLQPQLGLIRAATQGAPAKQAATESISVTSCHVTTRYRSTREPDAKCASRLTFSGRNLAPEAEAEAAESSRPPTWLPAKQARKTESGRSLCCGSLRVAADGSEVGSFYTGLIDKALTERTARREVIARCAGGSGGLGLVHRLEPWHGVRAVRAKPRGGAETPLC